MSDVRASQEKFAVTFIDMGPGAGDSIVGERDKQNDAFEECDRLNKGRGEGFDPMTYYAVVDDQGTIIRGPKDVSAEAVS